MKKSTEQNDLKVRFSDFCQRHQHHASGIFLRVAHPFTALYQRISPPPPFSLSHSWLDPHFDLSSHVAWCVVHDIPKVPTEATAAIE